MCQTTPNLFQLNLVRQNNYTFLTANDVNFDKTFGKHHVNVKFHHDNLYNTSRVKAPFVQFYIQDNIRYDYLWKEKMAFSAWQETDAFPTLYNHKISSYFGITYKPIKYVSIQPMIGYSYDMRNKIVNDGFTYALAMLGEKNMRDDWSVYGKMFVRAKYIDPRFQKNVHFTGSSEKSFQQFAFAQINLIASSNELDDFVGNNVQKIYSDTLMPELRFSYQMNEHLSFFTESSLAYKKRAFK